MQSTARAAMCALALILAGCTAGSGSTTTASADPGVAESVTSESGTSGTSGTETDVPEADPLNAQIDWFVRVANGSAIDSTIYEERFADSFRRAVPFSAFEAGLASLEGVTGDWLVVNVDPTSETAAGVLLAAGEEQVRMTIEVDPADAGRITALLIQPANLPSAPASLEEAFSVAARSGDAVMLAASVTGTSCEPVFERGADEPTPLGSVFKLYVLGTLGDAIRAGEVAWDDDIVIRDELKSIPSGVLQDEPDGTVVSVEEAASLMISISDNTATDHLMDLLGRARIEATLGRLGMSDPSLSTPFLTTLELAALKAGPAAGLLTQYEAGSLEERRRILEQISDITVEDIAIGDLTEPVSPDTVEWFATPADMCRALATLWEMGAEPGLEPIREILTENPGIAPTTEAWESVAFKGGSEPGLVAVAWLTETLDGETYALTGSVLNTESVINEVEVVFSFAGARDLLAP